MFCKKCGKELPVDAAFCPACGTPVEQTHHSQEPKGYEAPRYYNNRREDPGRVEPETSHEYQENGYTYRYSHGGMTPDPEPKPGDRRGMAIASLILGIISLVCCCMPVIAIGTGLVAIILGALSATSSGQGMAVAGIVLGVIGCVMGIGYLILTYFVYSKLDMTEIFNELEKYS